MIRSLPEMGHLTIPIRADFLYRHFDYLFSDGIDPGNVWSKKQIGLWLDLQTSFEAPTRGRVGWRVENCTLTLTPGYIGAESALSRQCRVRVKSLCRSCLNIPAAAWVELVGYME